MFSLFASPIRSLLSRGWLPLVLLDFLQTTSTDSEGHHHTVIIILSTPFLIAGIIASLLNATLPAEVDEREQHPPLLDDDAADSLELGHRASVSGSGKGRAVEEDDKVI